MIPPVILRLTATFVLRSLVLQEKPIAAKEPPIFSGQWESFDKNTPLFYRSLSQRGNHLEGYHTAISKDARRVDAVSAHEVTPSIVGNIKKSVAHVVFQSAYGNSSGEATLVREGNLLVWKISQSGGQHDLPEMSTLGRIESGNKK